MNMCGLNKLVLGTLFLLLLLLPLVATNTYTFRNPGHSFLEFHPEWTSGRQVALQFEFRTQTATAFLLHHSPLQGVEGSPKPQLKVGLWNGQLNVSHHFGQYEEYLTVAKGLNHDKWHKVSISLDAETGDLSTTVDERGAQTLELEAFSDGSATLAYQEGRLISIDSVGGFNPEALQESTHFVGCIRNIQFQTESVGQFTPPVYAQAEVEPGCLDQCVSRVEGSTPTEGQDEVDPPCQHGGLCINHYTKTSCDCFSTGYEGKHCERQDQTTVTLQGSEWLSFTVYQNDHRSHSPTNRVAFEFKTNSPDGILFYGYEQYPQYNHLAVSLHNGTVHVSVVFVDQDSYDELYLAVGSLLNDDNWHRLVVEHEGHEVVVTLDGEMDKMTTEHDHPHLHMPNVVYYGGMEVQANTLGLKTEESFVGCLRSVYFNHHSILENLNSTRTSYHGGATIYGCHRVDNACLQFTHSGAFVQVEHDDGEVLDLDLDFKTVKADGMLLYTEVREPSMAARGYFQIALKGGQVELSIAPSLYEQQRKKKSRTFAHDVNDNEWHSLRVYYQAGLVHVQFDGEVKVMAIQWLIEMVGSSFLGFGPDTHVKYGFIGCLRKVRLQSTRISPLEVVHSQLGVGVTLGNCDLIDWCYGNDTDCQNGGLCVPEWEEAHCDCHDIHYEGRYCQFPLLRRTCDEYYQVGGTRSGVWQIDLDGAGPLPPTYVLCEMGVERDGRKYGQTHIDHNLESQTVVRAPGLPDLKKVISYRGMTDEMLTGLVQESESCQQFMRYNCIRAPLWLGRQTWLVSASGEQFSSVGGDTDTECGCNQEHECVDLRYSCNCDQRSSQWLSDSGLLRHADHVPVTEMIVMQQEDGGKANMTLGPLQCWGSSNASQTSEAMFTTETSYLQLAGWRSGDIHLRFRTTSPSALLLYQPSSGGQTSQLPQLLLALQGGDEMTLKMQHPPVDHNWLLPWQLNTGAWHLVAIEMGDGEMRVRVDGHHMLLLLTEEWDTDVEEGPEDRTTHLYVAGTPSSEDTGYPGLTGCVGGLAYNGEVHTLPQFIEEGSEDILAGCVTGCDPAPCLNGAECEEQWTGYTCHCANSLAHFGDNCEHNLNTDMIHILEKSSYLQFDQASAEPDLLNTDILMSFRTAQSEGLLLYMHDERNNFVQVEVREAIVLSLRYNSLHTIQEVNMTVPGLTDGSWQQVSLQLQPDIVHMLVNEHYATFPVDREKLTTFDQTPFTDSGLKESVVPFRMFDVGLVGYRVYVVGVPATFSRLEGVQGCVSGLKMGDTQYNLADLAEDRDDLTVGCPSGCMENPCLNSGLCLENREFNGQYHCDCLHTGYSGTLCDKEVGLVFDGSSFLVQKVETVDDPTDGFYELIDFKFATRSPGTGKSAMVFVRGRTGLSDYMLVYITNKGQIVAEVGIKREKVQLTISRTYATGDVYRVTLTRDHSEVTLKVDDLLARDNLSGDLVMDPPTLAMVGAVRKENFKFEDFDMYRGEIYNLFIVSDQLSGVDVRPLDAHLGYTNQDEDIRAVGEGIQPKTSSMDTASMMRTMTGPQVAAYSEPMGEVDEGETTLPPWDAGPAETVSLSEEPADAASEEGEKVMLHGSIAFIVCIVFMASLISGIVFIIIRSRRRGSSSVPQGDFREDEEEGLLDPVLATEVEAIPTAKLRQGPKSKRTPSHEDIDEEDEETPMLQSAAQMSSSAPPHEAIELTNFEQVADELPMMDEDDDLDLTLSPSLRGLRLITRQLARLHAAASEDDEEVDEGDTESEDMGDMPGEADQMEWDPQMDGPTPVLTPGSETIQLEPIQHHQPDTLTLDDPLPLDEPQSTIDLLTPDDPQVPADLQTPDDPQVPVDLLTPDDPHVSIDLLTPDESQPPVDLLTPDEPMTPSDPVGLVEPQSEGTPDSERRTPREVLTESQVLDILDDEDQQPTWDPTADSNAEMYNDDVGDVSDVSPRLVKPDGDTASIDTTGDDFYPASDEPHVADADPQGPLPLEPVVLIQNTSPPGSDSPALLRNPHRGSSVFSSSDSFMTAAESVLKGGLSLEENLDEDAENLPPPPDYLLEEDAEDEGDYNDSTLKASDNPRYLLDQYASQQPPADTADSALSSSQDHSSCSDTESEPRTVTPARKSSVGEFPPSTDTVVENHVGPIVNGEAEKQAIDHSSATDTPNHFDFDPQSDGSEDDCDSQNGALLVPEGTQPLKPPVGKSPGIPLKKGRKQSKESRKS